MGGKESSLLSPDLTFRHKKARKTKHNHHHFRNALYNKGVRHVSFSCSKRKRRSRRVTLFTRGRTGSCTNKNMKNRYKCSQTPIKCHTHFKPMQICEQKFTITSTMWNCSPGRYGDRYVPISTKQCLI